MNKKTVLKVVAYEVVGLAALVALAGLYLFISSWGRYLAPVWSSLFVAQYAHIQAGEVIPFPDDIIYTRSYPLERFGEKTNVDWLADYTRLIVPFFFYEKVVATPAYPIDILFAPNLGGRSFHVGGTTYLSKNAVILNERYLLDDNWNDQREALSTLVHELTHVQGGDFVPRTGLRPEQYEANTSAATVEILAAMCNYADQLACRSFWFEVEGMARTRLMIQFKAMGLRDDVYQQLANFLWRDDVRERVSRKSLRFWAENSDERWYIITAYSSRPFFLLVDGLQGTRLETGNLITVDWRTYKLFMPFDDAKDLLPGWIRNLIILSAKGKR